MTTTIPERPARGGLSDVLLMKVPQVQFDYEMTSEEAKNGLVFDPPLSLGYLSSFTKAFAPGYRVSCVDVNMDIHRRHGTLFHPQQVYLDHMEELIAASKADVFGIAATFVYNYRWVEHVVDFVRRHHPTATVVVGGGYPSLYPERSLSYPGVDFVVIGEGEDTLVHILNTVNGVSDPEFDQRFKISGWGWKNSSGQQQIVHKTTFIDDLDTIPFPDWTQFDMEDYFQTEKSRRLFIYGSRGCPYPCTFCSTAQQWGKKIRYRSAANVMDEIAWLISAFGIEHVQFVDDNMTANNRRFKELLAALDERKFPITWGSSNFAVRTLQKEDVPVLKRTNFVGTSVAVESGSERIQKIIKVEKKMSLDKTVEVVRWFKEYEMPVMALFIIGFPEETLEDVQMTFDYAERLEADWNQFCIALPFPKTELYTNAVNEKHLDESMITLESFTYRSTEFFQGVQWEYSDLKTRWYDFNIRVNFLNNPNFKPGGNRAFLYERLATLCHTYPNHLVAKMCLAHMEADKGNEVRAEELLREASRLARELEVFRVFGKYLVTEKAHPIVEQFLAFDADHARHAGLAPLDLSSPERDLAELAKQRRVDDVYLEQSRAYLNMIGGA